MSKTMAVVELTKKMAVEVQRLLCGLMVVVWLWMHWLADVRQVVTRLLWQVVRGPSLDMHDALLPDARPELPWLLVD